MRKKGWIVRCTERPRIACNDEERHVVAFINLHENYSLPSVGCSSMFTARNQVGALLAMVAGIVIAAIPVTITFAQGYNYSYAPYTGQTYQSAYQSNYQSHYQQSYQSAYQSSYQSQYQSSYQNYYQSTYQSQYQSQYQSSYQSQYNWPTYSYDYYWYDSGWYDYGYDYYDYSWTDSWYY